MLLVLLHEKGRVSFAGFKDTVCLPLGVGLGAWVSRERMAGRFHGACFGAGVVLGVCMCFLYPQPTCCKPLKTCGTMDVVRRVATSRVLVYLSS